MWGGGNFEQGGGVAFEKKKVGGGGRGGVLFYQQTILTHLHEYLTLFTYPLPRVSANSPQKLRFIDALR